MFCPQCGAPNEDDAIFCGNCGAVLNVDDASEPPDELPPLPEGAQPVGVAVPDRPPAPPPPRPAAAPAAPPTSGLAIASLLLGIGGLTVIPLIGSVHGSQRHPRATGGDFGRGPGHSRHCHGLDRHRSDGDGPPGGRRLYGLRLATAGIVMGWIGIGLMVLGLLAGVGFMACGICGAFGSGSY